MSFLSCEEMLAAARSQKITLAEAVLRSDLREPPDRGTKPRGHAAFVAGDAGHQPGIRPGAAQPQRAFRRRCRQGGTGSQRREAAGRRLPVRSDSGSPQNRRVQRLHEAIVAAPTAGSCGVLPAVLLPLARAGEADEEAVCEALYVAAGFGQVIAARATLAGAEGGCQAEVGAASAMAAAALCSLKGGTPEQCAAAAAMALGNLLGLVCDPVAGLVEVPCVKRNVVGAVNAVSCANMALAGVDYAIPCDEVMTPWAAWAVCSPRTCARPARAALPPRPPA